MSRANMLACSFGECRDNPEKTFSGDILKMGEEEEDVYLSR